MADTINFRPGKDIDARLRKHVARLQQSAPLGREVTLSDAMRDVCLRGLTQAEAEDGRGKRKVKG